MEEREAIELFKGTFLKSEELLSVFDYKKEEIVKMMDGAERLDDELFKKVDDTVIHGLHGCPMLSLAIVELIDNEEFNDYKERCVEFYKKTEDKFFKDGEEYFTYAKNNFLDDNYNELIDSLIFDFRNRCIKYETQVNYEKLFSETDFLKKEEEANIPERIDEIGNVLWDYFVQGLVLRKCEDFIREVKFWEDIHMDVFGYQFYNTRKDYLEFKMGLF